MWGKRTGPGLLTVCEQSPETGARATQELPQSAASEGGDRALFGKRPGLMEEMRSVPLESLTAPAPEEEILKDDGETCMHNKHALIGSCSRRPGRAS